MVTEMRKISILSGVLGVIFNQAVAQSLDPKEVEIEAAIEKLYSDAGKKAASESGLFLLEQLGDKTLLETAKPILKKLGTPGKFSPISDFFLSPSSTGYFAEYPSPGGGTPEVIDDKIFEQLLLDAGVDVAAFAQDYDLYTPSGLAKYNADLRRLLMQRFVQSGSDDGRLRYLAVEAINYDRLYQEQIAGIASIPSEENSQQVQSETQGSCSVSEDDALDYFADLYGGLGFAANNAVIAFSQDATTQVISRNPFVYKTSDPEICSFFDRGTSELESQAPELSNAAEWLRDQAIEEGCDGRTGKMLSDAIFVRDLDADGRDDLILSHDGIVCSGQPQRSIYCGAQVCSLNIFLRRGDLLKFAGEADALVESISNASPPIIALYLHGGAKARVQWDGSQFVNR